MLRYRGLFPGRALRLLSAAVLCAAALQAAGGQTIIPARIVLRLLPGAVIGDVLSDYNLSLTGQVAGRDLYEVRAATTTDMGTLVEELTADSRIQFAEEESRVELPEVKGHPFHVAFDASPNGSRYVNQAAYTQIDLGTAAQTTGPATIVAVLDTGVNRQHKSLAGKILGGYNAISPRQEPNDVPDGKTNAAAGHGTMVAGIVVRVSPHARIMPVRVLDADGAGSMLHVLQGIHYAVTHGARIINMSFGTSAPSLALEDALSEADDARVLLVASAGNDGSASPHYPAAYPDVIAVASVGAKMQRSSFSNFGSYIAVDAPGDGVRSTYWTGGYATGTGTSFSTPFVTGEASEIMARYPQWDTGSISDRIRETALPIDSLNPGYALQLGAGLIDVQMALKRGN